MATRRKYGPKPPYPKRPPGVAPATRRGKPVAPPCKMCAHKGICGGAARVKGMRIVNRMYTPAYGDNTIRCEFCNWPKNRPKGPFHMSPEAVAHREKHNIDDN